MFAGVFFKSKRKIGSNQKITAENYRSYQNDM